MNKKLRLILCLVLAFAVLVMIICSAYKYQSADKLIKYALFSAYLTYAAYAGIDLFFSKTLVRTAILTP